MEKSTSSIKNEMAENTTKNALIPDISLAK